PGPAAHLALRDWSVIPRLAAHGDIGFAEDYRDGRWESRDPVALLLFALRNEQALNKYIYGGFLSRVAARLGGVLTRNSLSGSRRNIRAHYDLGNRFYKLWLDPSMTYSSALFANENSTLEAAQHAKYDRILNKLTPGRTLEIGCGWGGFAERAVARDHEVRGITLSEEQYRFSSERLRGNAEFVLEDYRIQEGKYDSIVSIEMFEAVGERYWPVYFRKLAALLKPEGRAMVQTITIDDRLFSAYRKGGDMIRRYIFPGGMLPSPERFRQEAEKAGLRIEDRYAFGLDYARTMRHWLNAFDARRREVQELGFDEGFIRMWRFYLASCIACFEAGRTNVMQVELRHA
ncbi:MAG: class I SAM-dependent methyltransferase, partial [Alphaproteobacteria bacterium]|nr:class I SAM-dependent methyltransferase [Alphaproteobacteria bacterium]